MTTSGVTLPSVQDIVKKNPAPLKTKDAVTGLADNFDNFLKLFLTQLKNQDPTAPLDTNDMTAQLATFAGVEQQIKVNTNLDKLITQNKTTELASVLSFNGAIVKVENNVSELKEGKAYYSYEIEGKAEGASITIRDSNGLVVYSGEVDAGTGKHDYIWDGKDNLGNQLNDGLYSVEVRTKMEDGKFKTAKIVVESVVQAVSVDDGDVNLQLTNGESVTADKILYVGPKVL